MWVGVYVPEGKRRKKEGFHPNTFCLFDFPGFPEKVEFVPLLYPRPLDLNQMQTNTAGTSSFVSSEGNFEHCHPIHLYIRYPFISDMYIEYDKSLHKVASVVRYHTTQRKIITAK